VDSQEATRPVDLEPIARVQPAVDKRSACRVLVVMIPERYIVTRKQEFARFVQLCIAAVFADDARLHAR
jgi:hypothetical protein